MRLTGPILAAIATVLLIAAPAAAEGENNIPTLCIEQLPYVTLSLDGDCGPRTHPPCIHDLPIVRSTLEC